MKIESFRLERYFARYEFSAPYLLCSSDCESLSVGDLLALEPGAREGMETLWLGYTETLGAPELRQTIAGLYGESLTPEQILVHAGAEEAIFNFMNVALDPGDHMVVQAPCYQSLGEVARAIGVEVSEWVGDPENAWTLDLDHLKELLTERTRVVVVNFPHNPTGFLPDHDFIKGLVSLSERHGFRLFSDEVYRGLELDAADRLPALAELSERAVSLGVLSKTYGLPGLRIGWIATQDQSVFDAMASFKDYTTICSSGPSEFLATLALRHADALVGRNLSIIRTNLDHLDAFFARHPNLFRWYRPRAGSIAFPAYLGDSVETFCTNLVEEAGVMLVPGTLYDGGGYEAFRVGFGRRNLPEALERLEEYLKSE